MDLKTRCEVTGGAATEVAVRELSSIDVIGDDASISEVANTSRANGIVGCGMFPESCP
jgi:hypothetical protein